MSTSNSKHYRRCFRNCASDFCLLVWRNYQLVTVFFSLFFLWGGSNTIWIQLLIAQLLKGSVYVILTIRLRAGPKWWGQWMNGLPQNTRSNIIQTCGSSMEQPAHATQEMMLHLSILWSWSSVGWIISSQPKGSLPRGSSIPQPRTNNCYDIQ